MTPDFDRAAAMALKVLERLEIDRLPVDPRELIRAVPGAQVHTYRELFENAGGYADAGRELYPRDALTVIRREGERIATCLVLYEGTGGPLTPRQRFTLAHELGHILLGHDRNPNEAWIEREADHFALHLICPRPVVALLRDLDVDLNDANIRGITGMSAACERHLGNCAPSRVNPRINGTVRRQFEPWARAMIASGRLRTGGQVDRILHAGGFLAGYCEGSGGGAAS